MKRALAFTLMVLAIMIIAVSCEEPQAPHEHTYAEEWSHDDTFHWHASACGHEEEVSDKEAHKWEGGDEDGWIVDVASTETEQGKKHRECSVCGYKEEGKVPLKGHVHTFSAYDHNGSKHWRTCTGCGEKFSYTHSLTYVYDSDTHYQTCYCEYTTAKTSHSFTSVEKEGKKLESCICGYSNTLTVQVVETAIMKENEVKSSETGSSITITKEDGTTEIVEAVNVVENKNIVEIEAKNSVAAATNSATSSSSGTGSSSSSTSDDVNETKVSFPAGALKMNKDATKVSLTIKMVTPIEATSSTSEFQGSKTETSAGTSSTVVVKTSDAVVAGFDFELKGASTTGLKGTEGGSNEVVGTKITTYIARGICEDIEENETAEEKAKKLEIKYIGTAEEGDAPEIVSYDSETGLLVFRVCHFSKYAIIAKNIVATDNDGKMYKTLADAIKNTENEKITLLKDIELSEATSLSKSITLNLNGKIVTPSGSGALSVASESIVTITGGSANESLITTGAKIASGSSTVDGIYCATLGEAIEYAGEGSTITLLGDFDMTKDFVLSKSVTIDLSKKTLNMKTYSMDLTEDKNIEVAVRDGNIESSNREYAAFWVCYGNKLTLETVDLNDTTVASTYPHALIDVTVSADSYGSGRSPKLVIQNSTITSTNKWSQSVVNVAGKDRTALSNTVNIADITISGSTLDCKGQRTVSMTGPVKSQIDKSNSKNTKITGKNIVVSLSGGTHTINNTEIIFENEEKNADNTTYKKNNGKVLEVSGNNASDFDKGQIDTCVANVTLGENVSLTIKGSDKNLVFDVDGTSGYRFNDDGTKTKVGGTPKLTGTFTNTNGAYKASDADVYLTKDDDTIYVAGEKNLEKAIEEAGDYTTIKLLDDLTLTETLTFSKKVTLDMDGHKMTKETGIGISADGSGAELTITGNGTVEAGNRAVQAVNEGKVIIKNGQYSGVFAVCAGSFTDENKSNGHVEIEDGTFSSTEFTVPVWGTSSAKIEGGTFTAEDNAVIGTNGSGSLSNNSYTITISGGTFNGRIKSNGYIACGIYMANSGTVNLSGGTFNITGGVGVLVRNGKLYATGGTVTLTSKDGLTKGKVGDSLIVITTESQIVVDDNSKYPGEKPQVVTNTANLTVKDIGGNEYTKTTPES